MIKILEEIKNYLVIILEKHLFSNYLKKQLYKITQLMCNTLLCNLSFYCYSTSFLIRSFFKMNSLIKIIDKKVRQRLFKQTNDDFKLQNLILIICFLNLINQTTSTYTNTFIVHKNLLNPKQIITNTLKEIKPKFNPRFTSNDKQQKLNSYDISDVKTIRKQSSKEQVPQGTYYYTDYKAPAIKKLIPMSPFCPETGRTVCKDAKAYPT